METKSWIEAFRLRTLPLALASIGMGGFLAAAAGKFDGLIFGLCCVTTIFLQVLSNLANDYGDSIHGADHADRKGPKRAVQSGVISATQMKRAVTLFSMLSLVSGAALLLTSFGFDWNSILFFFVLGVLCIAAAIAYTVGNKPYGYAGLGDVAVLIFFGIVGVMGSTYLFTKEIYWPNVWPALSCGFFSMAVLNINNIRDIESDRVAGKFSIPVRTGKRVAVQYHWFLLLAGLFSAIFYTMIHFRSSYQLLFLLAAPLLFANGINVAKKPSEELDPYLKQMALSTLLFVVLFGVGNLVR